MDKETKERYQAWLAQVCRPLNDKEMAEFATLSMASRLVAKAEAGRVAKEKEVADS